MHFVVVFSCRVIVLCLAFFCFLNSYFFATSTVVSRVSQIHLHEHVGTQFEAVLWSPREKES